MATTVLVVDDSVTVRQQIGSALVEAGFGVVEASDGVEGKDRIAAGGIACVICDVNMPNKNGIELLEEIKSESQYQQLPVLMLTTEGLADVMARAKKAGAAGWIVKPFNPNLLVNAVKKLIAK